MNDFEKFIPPKKDGQPEMCGYNSRNFRADLKLRLKHLGLIHAKNLEEMVNWAVELGVERIERGKF